MSVNFQRNHEVILCFHTLLPPVMYEHSRSFSSLQALGVVSLLNVWQSLIVVLICIFLMTNDAGWFLRGLLTIHISFVKYVLKCFVQKMFCSLGWLFVFILWCRGVFTYPKYSPLTDMFLPACSFLIHFLKISFSKKFKIMIKSNLSIFSSFYLMIFLLCYYFLFFP